MTVRTDRTSSKSPQKGRKAPPDASSKRRRFLLRPYEFALACLVLCAAYGYVHFRTAYLGYQTSSSKPASTADAAPAISTEIIREDTPKKEAVLAAFKHAWSAYERDAFGFDNHHPIGKGGSNLAKDGIGYFIVDCLDALHLMGFEAEFARAREWVSKLSFDTDARHHAFETTIRVLGGLLAAHHLTGDQMFVDKAKDLGDRLLPIFETPSGIPASFVNLAKRELIYDHDNNGWASVAEAGTLQLEMRYLSHLTGDSRYWERARDALDRILDHLPGNGLAPLFLDEEASSYAIRPHGYGAEIAQPSDVRLGSRGDSFYEYLLKLYAQSNFTENKWRRAYDAAMAGVRSSLIKVTSRSKLLYTFELSARPNYQLQRMEYHPVPKQDHLVCFLPGLMFLGVTNGNRFQTDLNVVPEHLLDDWYTATELLKTCVATYTQTKTGLSPEIAFFRDERTSGPPDDGRDWFIDKRVAGSPPPLDARNILRPETVESLFVAYRSTGDQRYRDWAWQIFQAFEEHCKIPSGGYASILDVDQVPVAHEDKMETFFLAETLKYLYLIFSDESVLPLDQHVFTTEAHILPILEVL